MHHFKSNKEVVAAGHQFAKNIGMDTPLIEMAKMVTELATRLDLTTVRASLMAGEVVRIKGVLLDTITALQVAGADMTLIDDLKVSLATEATNDY
ncbi:hypothetical protein ACVWYV_003408 [Pantoea eucalypti]|jgi:hypothetical protein